MAPVDKYYSQEQPESVEKPDTGAPYTTAQPQGFGMGAEPGAPGGAGGKERLLVVGAVIAVVVVLAAVFVVPKLLQHGPGTTTTVHQGNYTTSTATIPYTVHVLSSCGPVNAPGEYRLASPIRYTSLQGACLNITSSNVTLRCNENRIEGSGPLVDVPPFTYGVIASGVNNVAVIGCIISNFSYGVMMSSVTGFLVEGSNVSYNYLSNVYLNGSSNGRVLNNYMSHSESGDGSLHISRGSTNDTAQNNSIVFDTFYGVTVNGTGERFAFNYVNGTRTSFYCSGDAGFSKSSTANGNVCYNNTACGFLVCRGLNLPPNISRIQLGSSIDSCGSIGSPGSYSLASDISMSAYVNLSILAADHIRMPCINVAANNVNLDCSNHTISNATIGIQQLHGSALRLDGCRLRSTTYGVLLGNATVARLNNVSVSNSTYGIAVMNSTGGYINSMNAVADQYGLYLLNSQDVGVNIFNLSHNGYGIYVSNSIGDVFTNGAAQNNSVMDVYSSPNDANTIFESMTNTACGLTNAQWAPCLRHGTQQNYTEIGGCGLISKPGTYHLAHNILNASRCIRITSNNVALDCGNSSISALTAEATGYGINATDDSNVTVMHCRITRFPEAIVMSNVTGFTIANVLISRTNYGISAIDSRGGSILNNTANLSVNTSILLRNTRGTGVIRNRMISAGAGSGIGIALYNSTHDYVLNNTAGFDAVGINVSASSLNNTISYNRLSQNSTVDYLCGQGSSGLAAENGGINYGVTKSGCRWIAMLPSNRTSLQCTAMFTPESVSLGSDEVYGAGASCFSVFASHSTINCNGHTVLATYGGTFASFRNNIGSEIENCYLKGFTAAITARNASTLNIVNNTVLMNTTGSARTQPTINVSYSMSPSVRQNNIDTVAAGVWFNNVTDGFLLRNIVESVGAGYALVNTTGIEINYNSEVNTSAVGMSFSNSTSSTLQSNLMGGSLVCSGGSRPSTGDIDDGYNSCSHNSGCAWISASSSTCH